MARARSLFSAIVTALLVTACAGDPSSLDGSVSDFYPLGFSEVRARLYSSELAIEYVSAAGEAVVRLTVRRDERDPTGPTTVDLAAVGDVTGSSNGAELPPFASGTLNLDSYRPREGALVAGTFEALLYAGTTVITLHGAFDARLDVVEGL